MQIFTSVKISHYTEIFICIVYILLQGHRALPILATAVSGRQTHQYTGLRGTMYNRRAENQSGRTQNQVLEVA